MIHKVVRYGQPILESIPHTVHTFSDDLRLLIEDMFATMYAHSGVGLAAPQIGHKKRLAVIDTSSGRDPEKKLVLINPEIVSSSGAATHDEGCLSLPGFCAKIKRPSQVRFKAQDQDGNPYEMDASGYLAQAVQHECEHLRGILYIEHASPLRRDLIRRKIRKLQKEGLW